jgi:hypothetical protein
VANPEDSVEKGKYFENILGMKRPRYILAFILATLLIVGLSQYRLHHILASKRWFLVIEYADSAKVSPFVESARRIASESTDVDSLLQRLRTLGDVRVSHFTSHSVIHVVRGTADTSMLDREVRIESFVGSPAALLKRVANETGINIGNPRWWTGSIICNTAADSTTRISVQAYHGSIRGLLALRAC